MSDSWFRFYNSAPDHPKVVMLPDAHFRTWVELLSLASKLNGVIPDSMEMLARTLRKSPQKAANSLQVLLSAGLIDQIEGGFVPHNWEIRQFKSDGTSTERVKRFRNKERNVSETEDGNRPEQNRTEQNIAEKKDLSADAAKPARKRASKQMVEPESFAEFWLAYPDSRARVDAIKAYSQALDRGIQPEAILAGAKRYAFEVKGKEREFIKMAGGWLRQERWADPTTKAPALSIVPRLTAEEEQAERENLKRLGVI